MTRVTCRLTAKIWYQLRNPMFEILKNTLIPVTPVKKIHKLATRAAKNLPKFLGGKPESTPHARGISRSVQPFPQLRLRSWASAHRDKWGSADPPGKMDEKLKRENMQKRAVFYGYDNILRAIGAGRCRERRYADHIFIQMYFRMPHFVVKFSQFSSPQAARGH